VEVKDQVEHLGSLVRDIGVGGRGYLLTGDASYLPIYENALKEIPTQSAKLAQLIEDNPKQVAAVANLQKLIAEKLSMAAQALSLAQQEKTPETIEMFRDGEGKRVNDEIRAQMDAMTAEEDRLLAERENTFASRVTSERNEMIGLVTVEIALIVSLTLFLLRSQRLQLTADLRIEEANATTDRAQESTLKAIARTEQAEVRVVEADTRTEEAETRRIEGIRASEVRYRRLFETAQDGIVVLDAMTGRVVDANPFMKDLLGYSQEEIVGLKLWELASFKGSAASKITFTNLVQSGRIQNENLSLETKDGRQIQVEFMSNAYHMDDNLLVQCNIRDITERRRMENELVESESKFRLLAENISDVFWIASPDFQKLQYLSPACESIWGRSAESLYANPETWFEAVLPEDRERVGVVVARLKQNMPSVSIEYRIVRPDGSVRWIHDRGFQVLNAEGELTHLTGIATDITEREREENVRRETEERYRALFDYAPDGILIVSPENIYIDANVSICRMLGYTREELVGLAVTDIVAEVDFERIAPALSTIRAKTDHHREWRFRRKDGSFLEVDAFSTVMPDGNVLAMIRDITDRKTNEARFRRLVDSNAQSIMFWNTQGQITGANDAFLHLIDYTREEMEAGSLIWTSITAPEYAELDRRAMKEIAATGACDPYEKEFIRKDGMRVSVLIGGANFEDNPEEGVAFMVDLTERKCAAEQIAEQAALLDEAQDAIIVRDLEGKAIFWNKGAERMYGWTRQEVLGLNVSKLLFRDPQRFAEANALTINHGKWSGELKHLTKDKHEITIEARWTLIRDNEGHPKSVLAINTDVTEKKKIESQFLRTQRMESIGTLAGGVAHDLNNILAPILMSIELLKQTARDPESLDFLETIEVSAKRGADIVKQVLSFARGVEGERIEIQPKRLLKDLESIIKNTFPKNIRLQFSISDDAWMILGDPTQVHQILLNLCVNARDAMPNGGTLTVGVENCELDEQYAAMNLQAKAGRYVNVNVTDSGTGIPQGILDKIFEPFFTTKEINEGTGLGLSTVMAIVKSHGGIINVYSETGKGTTFKVYLPAMELSPAARQLLGQQISVPRGKGEMVLVIDDEASILTITGKTLQAFDYRVLTATDGAEAVAVFAEHKNEIAVVVTDMSMPFMDGAAVIRALTKINPEVKIIATSGLNANGDMAKVSGITVKHFLTKPYTAGTLLKVMRTVLDRT